MAGSVLGVVASAAIGAHEAACRLGLRHRRRNAVAGSEGGEAMGIRVTAQEAFQAPSDEAVPEDPFHIRSLPSSSRAPRWALRLRDAAARLREGRQAGAEEGSGTGVARRGRGGERVGSLLRVREGGGEARGEEDGTEEIESGKASTADAAEGEGRDKAKRKKSEHAGRVVAVKVQYPDALPLMLLDLKQLRSLASFLSACEIQASCQRVSFMGRWSHRP